MGRRGDGEMWRCGLITFQCLGDSHNAVHKSYKDLRVYRAAIEAAMRVFELTKRFSVEERFSMVDQMPRSSRSVCSNIGEAWRKRRYPAHFKSKLSDSEGEAEETRVWADLALRCGYLSKSEADEIDTTYDGILGQLVRMIDRPEQWTIAKQKL